MAGLSLRNAKRQRSIETLEARLALDGVPTVPTALAVNESLVAGAVNISLSWTPSIDVESGIKNYKVFRNGTLIGSPTVPSLVDPALSAASLAEYTVVAVNNADAESAASAPLFVAQLQQGVSNAGAYTGMIDSWINQVTPNSVHSVRSGYML